MVLNAEMSRAVCSFSDMVSSTDQFGLYANWSGSKELGITLFICAMTNVSRHFMSMGVKATWR